MNSFHLLAHRAQRTWENGIKFVSNLGFLEYNFYIVPSETINVLHLPKIIVISKALVEDFDDPDVLAGYVLAQIQREVKSTLWTSS